MTTIATERDFTAELRAAAAAGQLVVCSVEPFADWPVTDAPRGDRDPEPWAIPGIPYRISGRNCHAVNRGPIIERAGHRNPACECQWVRNGALLAWDRITRNTRCAEHGRHDHWQQNCEADTAGPWVLWLCPEARERREITGDY